MDTYFFQIDWYSEYDESGHTKYGTIGAKSFKEAVTKITNRFPNVEKINVEKPLWYDGFTFLDKETWNRLLDEDDDYPEDEIKEDEE